MFSLYRAIGPDGTIYIATSPSLDVRVDSGFVYAFHPDGSVKWRFRTDGANLSTGAVGLDGTYYYGSLDQYLYAIDSEGNLKWQKLLAGATFETEARPAITSENEVIVAVGSGVTALDAETGETLWHYEKDMHAGFRVSIDQKGNLYTGTPNSLLTLTSDGALRWEHPFPFGPLEVLIGKEGTLYFSVLGDTLFYAMNSNGNVKWTFNTGAGAQDISIPALDSDGNIFVIGGLEALYKLNTQGELQWKFEAEELTGAGGIIRSSRLTIDKNNTLYTLILAAGPDKGNFWAINQDGTVKWDVQIERQSVSILATPAIAPDGTLFVAGHNSLNAIR